MKILLIAPHPFFQNRGTPIAVKLVATVLSEMGHAITLLTLPEGEAVSIPRCRIVRVKAVPGVSDVRPGFSWKKGIYDVLLFFAVLKLMKTESFDLVHAVEEAAFLGVCIKKIYGIPFIYDMDSSLADQLVEKYPSLSIGHPALQYFQKMLFRESIGVLPVCRLLENQVKEAAPSKRVQRLEDISLLNLETGLQEAPAVGDISGNPVVMYIGNLEQYQGIDLLLKSFRDAAPRFPEARLFIIGGAGKAIERYRNSCRNNGMEETVCFMGPKPVSELNAFLARADILVSPRISGNNTPMKIFSYLDSGKPVLATRLPTHTQVLDDSVALLAKPEPEAFRDALVQLMTDEALRIRLGENGKARAAQEFSFPAFRKKLQGFYRDIEAHLSPRGYPS